jgi:hypothetical protein
VNQRSDVGACALTLACGGGGGPGASAPAPNTAGTYSGVVLTNATPGSHCFAAGLARLRGHGFRHRIAVQQNLDRLSGTLENLDMEISCSFAGTVSPNGMLSWSQSACSDGISHFSWSSEAQRPCELQVVQTGHRFQGQGALRGALSLDWTTTDRDTGVDLGAIVVQVTVDLQRQ